MIFPIQSGGGGWWLRAAYRAASAWAWARRSCSAWYWAMPCDSSEVHCWTWAAWAACVRFAFNWVSAELRSKELNWVTAAVDIAGAAGGPMCGRITVPSTMVHTTTALKSGTTPLTLLSFEVALPLGRCSGLSAEQRRLAGRAQEAVTLALRRQL